MKKNILLVGSYGRGNIGDDIFLVSALELFKDANLFINCADETLLPEKVRGNVTTISTTSQRDIFHKISVFRKIDAVIFWGGDLWVLLYGDKFPRQSLYKMLIMNIFVRMFGKKVLYIGVGIGDLSGYDLSLARSSARLANQIVVRESRSQKVLNLPGKVTTLPDLAINLPYLETTKHVLPQQNEKFIIGISILYHIHEPAKNFAPYIESIAKFVNGLDTKKFSILLIPMLGDKKDPHNDLWASEQLAKLFKKNIDYTTYHPKDIESLTKKLSTCHVLIGTRLHANILATLSATPCIGISYRPKIRSFFQDSKIEEYCLDMDNLQTLGDLFKDIHNSYSKVSGQYHTASKKALEKRIHYKEVIRKI